MKLRALRLHNVKRFADRGIAIEGIGDGVNVLSAANEAGKSTCFEALHALFFQPYSGTPVAVQALRPYSLGNPLIEADIETEAGRYRLTKQFYKGRGATVTELGTERVVAQADEAERFIADLTRGGVGGPAGLLWVRQGLTGLEKRTKSEEDADRKVRETLLTSVQGEVEALTGGRRMAEIVAACDEALDRIVTATLRPKAGGPYAKALEEREQLLVREQQLAADVAALREALDRRRVASARLAELQHPDEATRRDADLAAAEASCQAARSHVETLRAAEAELSLATDQHRAASKTLTELEAALRRAGDLSAELARASETHRLARATQMQASGETERLQAQVQSAEEAEHRARQDKSRLEAAEAARDATERHAAVQAQLAEAESLRDKIEGATARLATLSVPDKLLEDLTALEIELARLEAARSAARPSLAMHYADPANPSVSLDGTPLTPEMERSFTGTAVLEIAGVGQLTIRSQHTDDAAGRLTEIEDRRARLLAGLGVDSSDAARQRHAAARRLSDELALDKRLLAQTAPKGIDALREELARLGAKRGEGLELKFDPAAIRQALETAEAAVLAARNALREARPLADAAQRELASAHAVLVETQAELRTVEAVLGPAERREPALAEARGAVATAGERRDAAAARVAPLRARADDLEAAELTLQRVRGIVAAAQQEILERSSELADLNGQIRAQADRAVEETWHETQGLLADATARVTRYEREVKTLDRLRRALATARSSARDLYLKPVITELRPLIGLLFDDITVAFNEETLLPETVLRNGQQEEVERLSGGMREQLSVLTRLAFARLLARDGRPAPVILDDALVYSDDDRIERMFEALHRQSRDQQILVFSCRQRAFSRLGGNVLTMTDWTPH